MPDPEKPAQPNASATPGGASQPPPPGYVYGWYAPATPSPAQQSAQPTGGTPAWFKKYSTLLMLLGVGLLVLWSMAGSLTVHNTVSKTTAQAMQTGPRLTRKETVEAIQAANQAAAKLAKDQEELRKRQDQILGTGKDAGTTTTATTSNSGTGSATTAGNTSGPAGGTGQVSETQKILEEIRAERLKQQYASLWTSPIVAVRADPKLAPGQPASAPAINGTINASNAQPTAPPASVNAVESDPNQKQFPYDHSTGPYHVIQKGTIIGATLMLDLDGERGGPVIAQINKDDQVYVRNTDVLLMPEGTELIGMAQPVAAGNQRLLGVSFESVVMQDGYAVALVKPVSGLSQEGNGGLSGQVNTHTGSKLLWSFAIGAIEGLSTGSIGFGSNSSSAVILRTPGADMAQLFQGILNRPNSVKIPAGTRIKIILTDDLNGVPEYANHQMKVGAL